MGALFKLLLCIQAFATPAHSEPSTTLEIALSADVAPFSYMENGTLHGINYEILNQLSQITGMKFTYKLYPHIRLQNSLSKINPDMTIFFSVSCDKYSDLYEKKESLYTAKPTLYLKESVSYDKEKIRVGMLRGACTDLSTKYLKRELITDVTDTSQVIEMLYTGRLDGICGLPAMVNYLLKQRKHSVKLIPHKTDSQTLEAVICRKKNLSPELKKKLDEAFKSVKIPSLDVPVSGL